jgi:hypothetical protein
VPKFTLPFVIVSALPTAIVFPKTILPEVVLLIVKLLRALVIPGVV